MLLITKIPESADVTKNTAITMSASTDVNTGHGKSCRNWNNIFSVLLVKADKTPLLCTSNQIAVLPKMVIHKMLNTVGTTNTHNTNSRTVRPREILAIKRPTKGAQEIHQAQYTMVQDVNQSLCVLS